MHEGRGETLLIHLAKSGAKDRPKKGTNKFSFSTKNGPETESSTVQICGCGGMKVNDTKFMAFLS